MFYKNLQNISFFCITKKFNRLFLTLGAVICAFLFCANQVSAATLSVSPPTGQFTTGSTFTVSVYLDTKDQSVNTVQAFLMFPPDKLQLVSPSTGHSIMTIWMAQPKFDNQNGRIELLGGMPGGITVSQGLITDLMFRVKSVGLASLKFSDASKVLLNDGRGTDALTGTISGVYKLVPVPPAGPIVTSETHPDQAEWFPNPNVILRWANEGKAEGYSYVLSENATDIPDDISEGNKESVLYKNLGDGTHFFHIKSLENGVWGGVTHYAVNVDTTPPADFKLEILPALRTTRRQPIIQFSTTDKFSGVDHYEIKIVPLTKAVEKPGEAPNGEQRFFIEAQSPFIPSVLPLGTHAVIVRVYDKAGNFTDVDENIKIITPFLRIIQNKGLEIDNFAVIPWNVLWILLGVLIILLILALWRIRKWHAYLDLLRAQKELPSEVKKQLDELQEYRKRYGKTAVFLLLILSAVLFNFKAVRAEEVTLAPPYISSVSKNITNNEIFYVGGKTELGNTEVVVYLQNLQSGAAISQNVTSDKRGDWFYRHNTFLTSGNYLLWAQSKLDNQMSPPSPQIQISVRQTAIQFWSSRLSYEVLYFIISAFLFLILACLVIYNIICARSGKKKHRQLMKEVKEAEESVRRGFAVLRRDIESELGLIKKIKLNAELGAEEKEKERQLLKDLLEIEKHIGKEIWDIEKVETSE